MCDPQYAILIFSDNPLHKVSVCPEISLSLSMYNQW